MMPHLHPFVTLLRLRILRNGLYSPLLAVLLRLGNETDAENMLSLCVNL